MGAQSWTRTRKDERAKTEAFAFSYSKELCAQNFARPSLRVLLQLCAPIFAAAPPPLRALLCSCSSNFAHSSLRVLVQLCVSYFARARGRAKISKQAAASSKTFFARKGGHTCKRAKDGVQRRTRKAGRAKQYAQNRTRKAARAKQSTQKRPEEEAQSRKRKGRRAKEGAQKNECKRRGAKEGAQRRVREGGDAK